MADPEFYRSKDEVERWRSLDPIEQLKRKLIAAGLIDDDEVARLQVDVDRMADEAARFAEESPDPPRESLGRHVYHEAADA
jgi:pyruvate dehydrogenase E1 component alpha subunit